MVTNTNENNKRYFDGIITVTKSNKIYVNYKDGEKEFLTELKFSILKVGEVFYKVRKLSFIGGTIDYEYLLENLDSEERNLLGKYFNKKRKEFQSKNKLPPEDIIQIRNYLVFPVIVVGEKNGMFILNIENRTIQTKIFEIVNTTYSKYQIFITPEPKQSEILLFVLNVNENNELNLVYKSIKSSEFYKKFGNVLSDLETKYEMYNDSLQKFVNFSKNVDIVSFKKDLIHKILSFLNKGNIEKEHDDVYNIVTNVKNLNVEKKNVNVSIEKNYVNTVLDEILNESSNGNNDDVISFDSLMNDDDNDEIPF